MNRTRTILVVDDDAFIRRPLEQILVAEGFRALTAVDGNDCLDRLNRERPDLIILDIMMPGRDGFEVCREIKGRPDLCAIPIVMLSARGRDRDREMGFSAGAAEYITKPYSPSELIQRIRDLLN